MQLSAEANLALAKLIREKGALAPFREQAQWIRKSNSFVTCARLAARSRGGLELSTFDWPALSPNWKQIDHQMRQLLPPLIESPPLAPDSNKGHCQY